MPDKKISALDAATTPLAGTEVLPIVQSSTTKKVSVADLTAGRAVSATEITATTGNVIIGTSGKGIDFSATAGTGTSELLADYEEGTWSPTVSSTSGTITTLGTITARYTKIGRIVNAFYQFSVINNGTGAGALTVTNFPFAPSTGLAVFSGGGYANNTGEGLVQALLTSNGISYVRKASGTYPATSGEIIYAYITYEV